VRLDDQRALVQTLDFFPPVVDDPEWYGRIAAANALSDVYAMGGSPLTAMNIVGFPKELSPSILGRIMKGGAEKVLEAGAILVGGHSVQDAEIKYGLSVTGIVHPDRVVSNAAAQPGDVLVLTKPIGMGAMTTGMKMGKVDEVATEAACRQMADLNRAAAEVMCEAEARAATDITGFGLMGHALGMAEASGVTIELRAGAVPVFEGALNLAERKVLSGGAARTRLFLGKQAEVAADVPFALSQLCFDAETSGGLLIVIHRDRADELIAGLVRRGTACAALVGSVLDRRGDLRIRLI